MVSFWSGGFASLNGTIEAGGTGEVHLRGAHPEWSLPGQVMAGAKIRLFRVVDKLAEVNSNGALMQSTLSEWLNAGVDVEIEAPGGIDASMPVHADAEAAGTLTFSSASLKLGELRVPKLVINTPLALGFDAQDKPFDGGTAATVRNRTFGNIELLPGSGLEFLDSYAFDSPEAGERQVSPVVFLKGHHGDDRLELLTEAPDPLEQQRRRARILPVESVPEPEPQPQPQPQPELVPMPESGSAPAPELVPEATPAPEPMKPERPVEPARRPGIEPQMRPNIRPNIRPAIEPARRPVTVIAEPVKPRVRPSGTAAGELLACEGKRGTAPHDSCDRSPMPAPAVQRPALSDRGLRLPADPPRPPR
jgi:hypothetical protein